MPFGFSKNLKFCPKTQKSIFFPHNIICSIKFQCLISVPAKNTNRPTKHMPGVTYVTLTHPLPTPYETQTTFTSFPPLLLNKSRDEFTKRHSTPLKQIIKYYHNYGSDVIIIQKLMFTVGFYIGRRL